MKKMYGVNVPLCTPMTEDQRVDYAALERLCHFLIEKGVHGLYPNGSTGEMAYLSAEERKKVLECSVHAAQGRVNVFSMVGAPTTRETIELAQHAESCGADGIGVVTPYYYKLDDDEMLEHYKKVCASVGRDFPVYLYGIPQCAVNDISASLAQRILDAAPNVIGIKYSYPDMNRLMQYIDIQNRSFSVLVGPDNLFYLALCAGADGTISGNANVIPEHFVAVYNAFQSGNYPLAQKLQARTNQLIDILSSANNMARYKFALRHRGIIGCEQMREPLRNLSGEEKERLVAQIEEMNYTETDIDRF